MVLYIVLSRITALLLDKEKISHLYFKISLYINKNSITRLKQNSYMFLVIQQAKVIIWNEVSI